MIQMEGRFGRFFLAEDTIIVSHKIDEKKIFFIGFPLLRQFLSYVENKACDINTAVGSFRSKLKFLPVSLA